MKYRKRLAYLKTAENEYQFDLDESLNGGFGGTNGGVLASLCINVARDLAPGREPVGLDARFIRSFKPGTARVTATLLNAGRTLSTISVDVIDSASKLTTRGTVSLVDPYALAPITPGIPASQMFDVAGTEGKVWREHPTQKIPLIKTFQPRFLGKGDYGIATAVDVLWDEGALQEAVCIAADISVGPPVASALKGKPVAMPNPDLSLRFAGPGDTPPLLVSTCRLEALNAGLATTQLKVWDQQRLVAVGVSTTTCLGG
jgi:acyl-coenzyme A thioesterase PaaI-like protein